ncbi:TonB family protein [Nitratifractor salsuginis]|uniref:TonB family protein n=1 Tax=Nitratifractor salsuginis (strain DSM 16511 / JCM 12458 / E9I37-1) TaxID=749222 RepID=E6X0R0_NITSE|nr:TonB family protein [Nitratifractor salsuginis]ADV45780.1 TonB family protein [Nitratifractor salsuginis DSM 16511]
MRRLQAFVYAAAVYGALGGTAALLIHQFPKLAISEEARSTAVTLVNPEQSTSASQSVNSEASPAPAKEAEPPKTPPKPEPPEVSEEPPPAPPQTSPEEPPKTEPPKEETPPEPVEKVEAVEHPANDQVTLPPPKPLKAPTPFDPQKLLALKAPLPEPEVKKHVEKVKPPRQKKHRVSKRAHKTARKISHQKRGNNSVRSRARRGGTAHVNRLLARIKRRIARNKSYPIAAKRRRLQGTVRVSFIVTRSGGVRNIRVSGPRAFAASARSAVRRAFPVSVGEAAPGLPRQMSVTLSYRLR